uniref:Cyclin N-terminal domain-containing protein n=1 Tax=Rhabditophanes sp. KR3021 TaxID=114890 RepID=A0AC35TZA2_9BILA
MSSSIVVKGNKILEGLKAREDPANPNKRWIFTEEEMSDMPSIRDGLSAQEVLDKRRLTAGYITQIMVRLNGRKSRAKHITQLCTCIAIIHMHRFYTVHSYKLFHEADVAAACLFLACKTEDCFQKLDNFIAAWYSVKFPDTNYRPLGDPSLPIFKEIYHDAKHLLELHENIILQTIGFNLQFFTPLFCVLKHCSNCKIDRKIAQTAYFFVMDMIHLTDWTVRYSTETLACLGIDLALRYKQGNNSVMGAKTSSYEMGEGSDPCAEIMKIHTEVTVSVIDMLREKFLKILETNKNKLNFRLLLQKMESKPQANGGTGNNQHHRNSIRPDSSSSSSQHHSTTSGSHNVDRKRKSMIGADPNAEVKRNKFNEQCSGHTICGPERTVYENGDLSKSNHNAGDDRNKRMKNLSRAVDVGQ